MGDSRKSRYAVSTGEEKIVAVAGLTIENLHEDL